MESSTSGMAPAQSAPIMQVPGTGGLTLSASDRALINAVAAMQLRYGKPDEALALLQLTNRLWPDDRQTLRLLTQAFLLVEDYESAEMTEEAFKRHSGLMRPGRADLLRQALVHFGRLRLGEARASLAECFRLGRGEA